MKRLFVLVACCTILFGCQKEKPPVGSYMATFNYEYPQGLVKSAYLEITESTENTLMINGSELKKDGKEIKGNFYVISIGDFYVNGTWSKKTFSRHYLIKGDFTQTYYEGGFTYTNYGSFTIESE